MLVSWVWTMIAMTYTIKLCSYLVITLYRAVHILWSKYRRGRTRDITYQCTKLADSTSQCIDSWGSHIARQIEGPLRCTTFPTRGHNWFTPLITTHNRQILTHNLLRFYHWFTDERKRRSCLVYWLFVRAYMYCYRMFQSCLLCFTLLLLLIK